MGIGSLRFLAFIFCAAVLCNSAAAQTTTSTTCSAYPNQVNCTSNTQLTLAEQWRQSMAALGTAIAQQNATRAAEQVAWNAAATAQARDAAVLARGNIDATAAAMSRFAHDTASPVGAVLNGELRFDWSLLNYESRLESTDVAGFQNSEMRRWAWVDTPDGGHVLRGDNTRTAKWKQQTVLNAITTIRFYPASGVMVKTFDLQPLVATQPPAYETDVQVGSHAFATRMNGTGFDVTVPKGVVNVNVLSLAVAAIPGDLPPNFRIWVVDQNGEVVPAEFKVIGRMTVQEPVGPADGTCAGVTGHKVRRDAIKLTVSGGLPFATWEVLAAAPHLMMYPELQCRVMH